MFGRKRLAACGGFSDSQRKICNDATLSIYEKTLDKLMGRSRNDVLDMKDQAVPGNGAPGQFDQYIVKDSGDHVRVKEIEVFKLACSSVSMVEVCDRRSLVGPSSPCLVCSLNRNAVSRCSHCMRSMCTSCCRMCDGCEEAFCTLCTIFNFEERYDRVFCFDCNAQDMKQRC